MNKKINPRGYAVITVLYAIFLNVWMAPVHANPFGNQIPQVPAFLPMMTDVPMTEKLPIDGEWLISSIRKRIRIEGGRAYAVDTWMHLFVLKIEPLMVVLQDLRRTGPRQYTGQDLPLMGQLTATMAADGSLSVSVAGALGPARYSLIPVRMDDQQSFNLEKSGQYVQPAPGQTAPVQPAPTSQPIAQPTPSPVTQPGNNMADCKQLDVDRATGKIVCVD